MPAKPRKPKAPAANSGGSAAPGNPAVRAGSAAGATPGFQRGYLAQDEGGRYSKTGRSDDFSTEGERARDHREETPDRRGDDLTGDERGRPRTAKTGTPASSLSDDEGFGAASGPPYGPGRSPQARPDAPKPPKAPRKR
jgi:hypothetical protein